MTDLITIIGTLAERMASGRSATGCASLIGTIDRPVRTGIGAPVRLITPLLGEAIVMTEPDGTVAFFRLEPPKGSPLPIGDLAELGPHTARYTVNAEILHRVRFEERLHGCVISADLDERDSVVTLWVRNG